MTTLRRAESASRTTEAQQNRLIVEHMKLVPAIAAGFRGQEDFEGLCAIGREGLVKAARSYDPDCGTKFSTWAWTKIESEILTTLRASEADWCPKEDDPPRPPSDASYSSERIYEWESWGRGGNALAISEHWHKLGATLEQLRKMYDPDRPLISLSRSERKLIKWVFVDGMSIQQAAREERMSYYLTVRILKRALKIMSEVDEALVA